MLMKSTLRTMTICSALLGALLLFAPRGVQGDEEKPDPKPKVTDSSSKVKITAKTTKPDEMGKQTITLDLEIEKGWYIYANPVNNDMFEVTRTQVIVKGGKVKPAAVTVNYPTGKVYTIETDKFNIYEDKVTLVAVVQREAGDTASLDVSVKVNSCSKGENAKCLLPGVIAVKVDAAK